MTCARALVRVAAALVSAGVVVLSRAGPSPWLINETPSLPRGLYVRTSGAVSVGAVVAVAPPASARLYLASLGAPPQARLLKRVAAGPGNTVCRDGRRLTWSRGDIVAFTRDRRGFLLPAWRGCRRLAPDEVLVVGDSLASFDSRYFGPVRVAALRGVYREAWRW